MDMTPDAESRPGNPEALNLVLAFGDAIRTLIKAGENLANFAPDLDNGPRGFRISMEASRLAWDKAREAYGNTVVEGVLSALVSEVADAMIAEDKKAGEA